ncbi:glycosyltransferase family 4 protein [Corynebacterium sp. HMSC29G08]|uniref:glycosyltransferase family 4 protein n=1 Tax=Corynebacterium sp. HMSC29G08 TaxID=1581069 RepID=UPI0008A5BC04|nr:glycosyltransferase family 4 protein [Corynebacterium sp. HMSC29G08]OFT83699.1 alpha-(1-2)-phosphatidylinositol mannosyltransferase [Corynebacterium sp. HMSC29G08]
MTVLLVTNDFPPTVGGIQSYLRDYVNEYIARCGAEAIVVFASTPKGNEGTEAFDAAQPFTVVRWPRRVMLPTPATKRRMQDLIREHNIGTVWFGAAAPLALMGKAAKQAGAKRVVATTHGHEVGWSMLPGARQALQAIGRSADVITYISAYTYGRLRPVFGNHLRYVSLPSGVDTQYFRPATPVERTETRALLGVGDAPLVVCASRLVRRKGQDQLLRALPKIQQRVPGTQLVIVGAGPYRSRLESMAPEGVHFTGAVERDTLRDIVAAADVFAMPARTRFGGLDVEGLGIVYLEAQACGVPVVAGDSGGAPETVAADSGIVVPGRDTDALIDAVSRLLIDANGLPSGRQFVTERFSWQALGDALADALGS